MVRNMNLMLAITLLLSLAASIVIVHGERVLIGDRDALDERASPLESATPGQLQQLVDEHGPADYVWELKAFKRTGTYFSPRLGRRRKRSTSTSSSSVTEGESYQHDSLSPSASSSRDRLALLKLLRRIIKAENAAASVTASQQTRGFQYEPKPFLQDINEQQRPVSSFIPSFYPARMHFQNGPDAHAQLGPGKLTAPSEGESQSEYTLFAPRALRDHISPRLG